MAERNRSVRNRPPGTFIRISLLIADENDCLSSGKRAVRWEICISSPERVAPTWRKQSQCRLVALQVGGSFFGANLSSSKLEEAFSVPTCRPPTWSGEFRVRDADCPTGILHLVTGKPRRNLREAFLARQCRPASCGKLFWCNDVAPQVAASYFGANLSSRNLRGQISCPRCSLSDGESAFPWPRCRFPTEQWHFRGQNHRSYLSFCTFGRIHTRTNPKRPFGRPFGVRCLYSVLCYRRNPFPPSCRQSLICSLSSG